MTNYKKASTEEMYNIIQEKIPLNERMRFVYLPIIAMDCACYVGEDLLGVLRELKLSSTKKVSRELRTCIEGYRRDNYNVMHSDLYGHLEAFTKDFYSSITQDLFILQLQYQQKLLDMKVELSPEKYKLTALSYMVHRMVQYVIELDRKFSARMSLLLGENIHYTTEDNRYCIRIVKAMKMLPSLVGVPMDATTMVSERIDMSFKVYMNKLNKVEIQ